MCLCHFLKVRLCADICQLTADGLFPRDGTKTVALRVCIGAGRVIVDVVACGNVVQTALIRRKQDVFDLVAVRVIEQRMQLEARVRRCGDVVIRLADVIAESARLLFELERNHLVVEFRLINHDLTV